MLKRFRNRSEDLLQKQIREVIGRHGAEVHEKVRVADIVDIDKLDLGTYARVFQQWKDEGQMDPTEPFMLSAFIKDDAKHIFDSEFDFIANGNGKLTRALKKHGLAADELPHPSISRLSVRSPDDELRAFVSINSTKGP